MFAKICRIICLSALAATAARAGEDWPNHLLIVANRSIPESVALAQYYADRRAISTNRIFLADCPQTMQITRQQYDETLRDPLIRHLQERGWLARDAKGVVTRNDCWLLVLCDGVPLKITPQPDLQELVANFLRPELKRNEAAVDSELATLPLIKPAITGPRSNPFHKMSFFPPHSTKMMLVARLDGPNFAIARSLVDRALAAEPTGVMGRAFFDARGTQDPNLKPADDSIRAAYKAARTAGLETVLDEQEPVFPSDYPMTDVALYVGWYSQGLAGAVARPTFRFRPGAIVYHVHSFTATDMAGGWVGPCLARGAAASIGYVYEPYLNYVADPKLFVEHLLSGKTFVEAAYAATPMLSWQQTVVGDPLYRPFPFGADEQAQRLDAGRHPERAWGYLRHANGLIAAGKEPEAIGYLSRGNVELHSPILDEKLAGLYVLLRLTREAVTTYQRAAGNYQDAYDVIRVSLTLADLLLQQNRKAEALDVLDRIVRKFPTYEGYTTVLKRAIELAGRIGDDAKLDYYYKLIVR